MKKTRYEGHEQVRFDEKIVSKYTYLKHIADNMHQEWIMP